MKFLYIAFLLIVLSTSMFSEKFAFKFYPGSKQRIEAIITGEQYINGKKALDYNQKYKTIRRIVDAGTQYGVIEDTAYFYNQNTLVSDQVMEIKEESVVTYAKKINGEMIVNAKETFPTFRNLPFLPDRELKKGDTWSESAYEIQDLFNDKNVLTFPVKVEYTFLGYEKVDNKNVAKFSYDISVFVANDYMGTFDSRIDRVKGTSKTIMYFDNENGVRVREEYERHYSFLINTGGNQKSLYEFKDSGERIWYEIELLNKNKLVKDLKKMLKTEKVDDTDVKQDDKGVKLSLENINFYPNSSELLPEEKNRLDKISKILTKFKDKGTMVIGHTTDKGTETGRLKLSVERAKAVVDYLIDKDAINVLKSSFGGKGGKEPIADNSTDEGMRKNRRVEIYILEE